MLVGSAPRQLVCAPRRRRRPPLLHGLRVRFETQPEFQRSVYVVACLCLYAGHSSKRSVHVPEAPVHIRNHVRIQRNKPDVLEVFHCRGRIGEEVLHTLVQQGVVLAEGLVWGERRCRGAAIGRRLRRDERAPGGRRHSVVLALPCEGCFRRCLAALFPRGRRNCEAVAP